MLKRTSFLFFSKSGLTSRRLFTGMLTALLWTTPASADKHTEVLEWGSVECNGGWVQWSLTDTRIRYTPKDATTPVPVYNGNQQVHAAVKCPSGGILTQFSGNWIYHSPDCRNVGGGGKTKRAYNGNQQEENG